MGWIFFLIAVICYLLAIVGTALVGNPALLGHLFVALGLLVQGGLPWLIRKG